MDIVDISAAREHGIIITNVPDYCIEEVADHATSLSFMLMRNLPFYNLRVHEGAIAGRIGELLFHAIAERYTVCWGLEK